ncbi:MAG TPA: regulatory protein RecX [bacterium]|nr:regulatory protein RecX [bacterium]
MARIVGIKKGAHGTVTAVSDEGSLFHFKLEYYGKACEAASVDAAPTALDAEAPTKAYSELDDGALAVAVEALVAETRAVALLARAEQYRAGLERKLTARGVSRAAFRMALDGLESAGLLSDTRYASSWIRQRCRTHAEGPRSLSAALSARGIERYAIRDALEAVFSGGDRQSMLENAVRLVARTGLGRANMRNRLLELGWRHAEIDDALDAGMPALG